VGELNDILQGLESALGPLSGEPSALTGGITNRNYRVTLGGEEYVVRRPGKDTDLLGIDRGAELAANDAAAALGLAPAVAGTVADCTITSFVACSAVGPAEVGEAVEEIATALRRFHDSGVELAARFDVVALVGRYETIVSERGGTVPQELIRAGSWAARIRAALSRERARPCHNDLLAANVIRESGSGRLMIVDWEYAGMGDRRFDLGNLAVNNGFDEATEERLLASYYGEPPSDDRRASLKLMRVMSDVREAAWGVVQASISDLDFDFAGYGAEHFRRLESAVEGGDFQEWLAVAAA
jgi:thiamine kinase-like enzyme